MNIHKTFFGSYIDLEHILEISPSYFVDKMGSGGYFVGFSITYCFLDKPREYLFPVNSCVSQYSHLFSEGNILLELKDKEEVEKIFQKQVDTIVYAWKKLRV